MICRALLPVAIVVRLLLAFGARARRTALWTLAAMGALFAGCGTTPESKGSLRLEVIEGSSQVPARVEILDLAGESWIPEGALPVAGDCGMLPAHNWVPALAPLQVALRLERAVVNPFRETEQFYVESGIETELVPGTYRVRASRGPEFRIAERELVIGVDEELEARLEPERWIDLPASGWYAADDHLHLPRVSRSYDTVLAIWMAAEGLHVANTLQMGLARDVHLTPQQAFGAAGAIHEHGVLLVSGQENPRTHVLGHAITLGAPRWIDHPQGYLAYPRFWQEAHELGGLNGYAHFGIGAAEKGLALWGDSGLIDFLEVENFGFAVYDRWYEALNLGLRLTPTAGTDYPCVPNLPGRDRFYTHVDGELTLASWLDGVRAGRTFVTNGPMLELTVDGAAIGADLALPAAGTVRVQGLVRFDPARDRVTRLELVQQGDVVQAVMADGSSGAIELALDAPVERTTWLALRALGSKVGEVRPSGLELLPSALEYPPVHPDREPESFVLPGSREAPVSAAHTAAVWVTVAGTPPLGAQEPALRAAAAWATRLADLEHWLSPEIMAGLGEFPGRGDGVPLEILEAHRAELLAAVVAARARWSQR